MTCNAAISRPIGNATLRVLSLGAGVQSTLLALLAARGEIGPMPDAAIFADTQWEPNSVYEHLDWFAAELAFPIHRVTAGNLREDVLQSKNSAGQRFASMPLYTSSGGMGRRQCTKEYKIQPILKEIRRLIGVARGKPVPRGVIVEQWIGISTDEIQRLNEARQKWLKNRWPLIELGWSRHDCQRWFGREYPGRPLAKSACIGCPSHDDKTWRAMKENDPEAWAADVAFDDAIREGGTLYGRRDHQYLHRSRMPLPEADFSTLKTTVR